MYKYHNDSTNNETNQYTFTWISFIEFWMQLLIYYIKKKEKSFLSVI